jgi:hypothetical protein
MGILDNLEPPTKKRSCGVAAIVATLDKKDAEILLAAIKNPDWGLQSLSVELGKRGITASRSLLERHRKGLCLC